MNGFECKEWWYTILDIKGWCLMVALFGTREASTIGPWAIKIGPLKGGGRCLTSYLYILRFKWLSLNNDI